jgi:hypothetical protein
MGFVQRELDRINDFLGRTRQSDPQWPELYAGQQALACASEPTGFESPIGLISRALDTQRHMTDGAVLLTSLVLSRATI